MSVEPGLRVLIVEDEPIVAMDLTDMVESWGHSVVGPANRPATGTALARSEAIDFAVLDVNLGRGQTTESIAAALREREIPFIFLSAYNASSIEYRQDEVVLSKPIIENQLFEHLVHQAESRQPQDEQS
ncbi:response regulator [Donghicola sp. XS_ASV15]|uniref:response regulator n=1 Tax=Donghicola sp. XS_ASV15 TaxID=3241295 RepID=UPI003515F723